MKPKVNEMKPDPPTETTGGTMVLFGGTVSMLPEELQEMGLAGKVEVREVPGVVPDWKPVQKGDFLFGRCVDIREVETRFSKRGPDGVLTNPGLCAVFETSVPGGFRTVWLGADLRIKLANALDKVYTITFVATKDTGKGNPLKIYQVMEVIPKLSNG